jgi:glycosyltransferase involved in cell wall biosynthesis
VENLQAYYHYASAVVAPIFSGGGMKVKIAEALMHNKTIISTKFAAVGYEEVNSKVIVFARTPLEFAVIIDAIAQPKDQESRSYYVKYYSAEAIAIKINRIVQGGSESDTHNH